MSNYVLPSGKILPSIKISKPKRNAPIGLIPTLDSEAEKKLKIGLEWHSFIQSELPSKSADFEDAYKQFYMKPLLRTKKWSSADFKKYFEKLYLIGPDDTVADVNTYLFKNLSSHRAEVSYSSKAVHTVRPNEPIYDSIVKTYLRSYENVKINSSLVGTTANLNAYAKIVDWYNAFAKDPRYESWIKWFDSKFPTYQSISNTKKIDFIILSCK